MFLFRFDPDHYPTYMTPQSAAADVRSTISQTLKSKQCLPIPTGIYILGLQWEFEDNICPEIQIRARSGLAMKHGITLMNGIGTIDADYRDEIKVLLYNTNDTDYQVDKGERIAQMVLSLTHHSSEIKTLNQQRTGGFGSTGEN